MSGALTGSGIVVGNLESDELATETASAPCSVKHAENHPDCAEDERDAIQMNPDKGADRESDERRQKTGHTALAAQTRSARGATWQTT